MKYRDFYTTLTLSLKKFNCVSIGPSVSISGKRINISNYDIDTSLRYIIFPIKIYGHNIKHLNILILDQKTKIIERYEPFNQYLNFDQINDLLESLLYKLMEDGKIYFLKYQTTLNSENLSDKNCGMYCIKYITKMLFEMQNNENMLEKN